MKKLTPMMKLIEWIETMPATNTPATDIKAKATELLAEEQEFAFEHWNKGLLSEHIGQYSFDAHFTQTYGGGDE